MLSQALEYDAVTFTSDSTVELREKKSNKKE